MVAASQLGVNLPVTYLLNILACDSKVRGAQRLPREWPLKSLVMSRLWLTSEESVVAGLSGGQ